MDGNERNQLSLGLTNECDRKKARDFFIKILTIETRKGSEVPEQMIKQIIGERIMSCCGREVLTQFEQKHGKQCKPLSTNFLLIGLLDELPNNIVLDTNSPPMIEIDGLSLFDNKANRGRGKWIRLPFSAELQENIRLLLLSKQIDIGAEMERSTGYFLNYIKNSTRIVSSLSKGVEQIEIGRRWGEILSNVIPQEDIHLMDSILFPKTKLKPFIEVNSEKDINTEWNIDARLLFNYIFSDNDSHFFDDCTYILFSRYGIFYLKNGEIKLIHANEKYIALFYKGDTDEYESDLLKQIQVQYSHDPSIDTVIKQLREIIDQNILDANMLFPELKNELEVFILQLEERYKVKINNINFQELKEEKYKNVLKKILEATRGFLSHFTEKISIISKSEVYLNVEDKSDFVRQIMAYSRRFLNPEFLSSFLGITFNKRGGQHRFGPPDDRHLRDLNWHERGKLIIGEEKAKFRGVKSAVIPLITPFSISVEELRLIEAYPELVYFLCLRFIAIVFKQIIGWKKAKSKEEYYDKFKETIGNEQLKKERNVLQSYGFEKWSDICEYGVLMQYFMRFGLMYMMERDKGIKDDRLPEKYRQYFRIYLYHEEGEPSRKLASAPNLFLTERKEEDDR